MENNNESTTGMKEEDKAISTIASSPSQDFIAKVDRRDKLVKVFEIAILFALVAFNIFFALRLQNVIDTSRKESLQRIETAKSERQETKNYIKCVLLIKFDVPEKVLTTRSGVEKALDECAENTSE